MSRRSNAAMTLIFLFALSSTACTHAPGHVAPPVVRIIAFDYGYVVPKTIPAGLTELRLINHGTVMHEGVLAHFLTPDARAAMFVDSIRAGDDVPTFEEDYSGPGLALPGDSTLMWTELVPGHYAVTCWYADHLSRGMAADFEVVPAENHATPPVTDLTVHMVDYNYVFEGNWSAGKHCVLVTNNGSEIHEFDPYRLEPGKTPADFTHWIETGRHGPAPARALGGSGTFPPGKRVWLPLTLTPGRHFAFCQMPARIGGKPHYQMGMVREFEVR